MAAQADNNHEFIQNFRYELPDNRQNGANTSYFKNHENRRILLYFILSESGTWQSLANRRHSHIAQAGRMGS